VIGHAKGAPINNRFIWNFMGDDVVVAVEAGVVASLRSRISAGVAELESGQAPLGGWPPPPRPVARTLSLSSSPSWGTTCGLRWMRSQNQPVRCAGSRISSRTRR